jgi:hypothetical protein
MMIAILLAVLGVPLWLVAGMVLATLYHRRRVRQAPGVFRCQVRTVAGTGGALKTTWGRMPGYAHWVHDVLLVNQGLALIRVLPIGVVEVVTGPDKGDPAEIKRLGPAPRVLTLRVDGDSTVEVAAGEQDERRMLGPFAGTAVSPPANR